MSSIENKVQEILSSVKSIDDADKKDEYIREQITKINEENDEELFVELAEKLIVDNDGSSTKYSTSLRMYLLYQLSIRTEDEIRKIEELLEEKKEDKDFELGRYGLYNKLYKYMWYYKWIIPDLPQELELENEMIDSANETMKYYYNLLGLNLAMFHKSVMLQSMAMGRIEEAKENYKLWQELVNEGEEMNDCEACEVTEQVNYYAFVGEYEKSLEVAQPVLTGELSCAEVPHITYGPVLKSMVALGKNEEVESLLPKAVELIESDVDLVREITHFIEVAYRLGNVAMARALSEKYENQILNNVEGFNLLRYFIATSPLSQDNYDKALTLASLYDKRNGNDYYVSYLSEYTGEEKRVEKFFNKR